MAAALAAKRARSNSLKQGLEQVPNQLMATTEEATALPPPLPPVLAPLLKAVPAGFFSDLVSFQWMIVPATSLKILLTILALWATLEAFPILPANPLSHLLFISYPLPLLPTDDSPRYGKGRLDVAFLAFYIIVFSFLRQAVTEYLIRPFAVWSGLKTETKQVRFMEQAYAIIYNLASGGLGLVSFSRPGNRGRS
jgi:acyl-CoA-dependent ceramide synthase